MQRPCQFEADGVFALFAYRKPCALVERSFVHEAVEIMVDPVNRGSRYTLPRLVVQAFGLLHPEDPPKRRGQAHSEKHEMKSCYTKKKRRAKSASVAIIRMATFSHQEIRVTSASFFDGNLFSGTLI